jgi:hypothetical protein
MNPASNGHSDGPLHTMHDSIKEPNNLRDNYWRRCATHNNLAQAQDLYVWMFDVMDRRYCDECESLGLVVRRAMV